MDELESLIDFFIETNSLKKTIRYSSCDEKVQEPTAGHSWKVTLMVPIIAELFNLKIDVKHAMEIANVHDLPEYSLEKDYDSFLVASGILSKEDKERSEEEVMGLIKERFVFGKRLFDLWKEYEERKTPEARFVRALDKIESHLHVLERGGTRDDVRDITHQATYADKAVENFSELKPLLRVIKKRLKAMFEGKGFVWKDEYNYPD